jgi:aminoglycoside phosphotransferase (APT) family kinase protein
MQDLQSLFPPTRFGSIRAVTPITAGLSGAGAYAVTTDRGEFFIRLQRADQSGFANAVAAQRLAAMQGLAPEVIYVDESAGAVISAKVDGINIRKALEQPSVRPWALRSLAECLARLHGVPASGLPTFDPTDSQSFWDRQSRRNGFPAWARSLGACVSAGNAALARDGRRVFSHNDLAPANLLWDGSQVWIVDWESAGLEHPYLDLATFSNFSSLSDDDAISLLALQELSEIHAEQHSTFISLRNLSRVLYGAAFLSMIPDLAEIDFMPRDATPTLPECYIRLDRGELDPKIAPGQALIGAALLRQAPM